MDKRTKRSAIGRRTATSWAAAIACALAMTTAGAMDLEGQHYDETEHVGSSKVVLNGAGVRMVAVFKGYVAGLYLSRKESEAEKVYALPGDKRIAVRMLVDVNSGVLARTFSDGIRKNYGDGEIEALRERMDVFDGQVRALGGVKKGDEIDLDFRTQSGTRIVVNGKPRGEPIAGEDFYVALLKMFIGERAVDKNLRAALLGKPQS